MDLQEYFDSEKVGYRAFAKLTGISVTSIYMYRLKKTVPSERVAWIIVKATDGKVTLEELR